MNPAHTSVARRSTLALSVLLAWAGGAVVPTGADEPRDSTARAASTLKFRIAENELYPESIAFDPVTGDYFLSSMGERRILRIHADGSYEAFLAKPVTGLASSIGMKVDAKRRALWVCTGVFSLLAGHDAVEARTGVLRFDIDSGTLTDSWLLDEKQESPYHIFNDLVLTPEGVAYATTTLLGRIYKIAPGAEAMTLVHQLDAGSHNNGITLGPAGRFLFVTVDRRIERLDPATGDRVALDVPDDEALGTDGLYFHDGSLILVKPRLRKVSRVFLGDDLKTVRRVVTLVEPHPDLAYPTTGVIVGDSLVFVATSYADTPRNAERSAQHPDVLIHAVPLNDRRSAR